jgi:hypothetical protein
MKRTPLERWLGAFLLAPVVAAGCQSYHSFYGVAEAPAAPALTFVYSESPLVNPVPGAPEPKLLATVDVPGRKLPLLPPPNALDLAKHEPAEMRLAAATTPPPTRPAEIVRPAGPEPVFQGSPKMTRQLPKPPEPPRPIRKAEPMVTMQEEAPAPPVLDRPPAPVAEPRAPEIITVRGSESPRPEPEVAPAAIPPAEPPSPPTKSPSTSTEPRPRTTTETPVNAYGHAADYSWLSGQLEFSRSKGWRLRYAGFDEEDPHGGSVTLVDEHRLAGMEDGQFVRIHGRFAGGEGKGIAPAYRIEAIEAVK